MEGEAPPTRNTGGASVGGGQQSSLLECGRVWCGRAAAPTPPGNSGVISVRYAIHMPSSFPPPCLISTSVFGMFGMMGTTGCIGRTGRIGGWNDRSIYSLSEWVHLRLFGKSFLHPRGSFWSRFGNDFNALGSVLETLGSQGAAKGGWVEKVSPTNVCGSFVGPPR